MRRSAVLGTGRQCFDRASDALLTWDVHRGAGLTVDSDSGRATPGTDVVLGWGVGLLRLHVPCRVVMAVDEASAKGFAYGTLAGHPESGEELFVVRLDGDDVVHLDIVAFSRPARWYSRLAAPLTSRVQQHVTGRYLASSRDAHEPSRAHDPAAPVGTGLGHGRTGPDLSPLPGCEVTRVCLDHEVNLLLAAWHEDGTERVAATLTLGSAFVFTPAGTHGIAVEPDTGVGYAAVSSLLRRRVARASTDVSGALIVVFVDGSVLAAGPSASCESWAIEGRGVQGWLVGPRSEGFPAG